MNSDITPSARHWWVAFVLTVVALTLPLCLAPYPPSTDLPQHLAQVAQAERGSLGPGQSVAWFGPNNLAYLPILALFHLSPDAWLARAVLIFLAASWCTAYFWIAYARQRSWVAAALACLTFYGGIMYWGMVNFLIGWPCLLLWWIQFEALLSSPVKIPWTRALVTGAMAVLLIWAHVLMFAFAVACWAIVIAEKAWQHRGERSIAKRRALGIKALVGGATFVPAGLFALGWMIEVRAERIAAGFSVEAFWGTSLGQRLEYLLSDAIGVGAPASWLFSVVAILWVVSSASRLGQNSTAVSQREKWDGELLAVGLFLATACFLLPDKFLNTIQFATRWLPCALGLLCLSAPGPRLRPQLQTLLIATLLVTFSLGASSRFFSFAHEELSGLDQALQRLPHNARLLGLDYMKSSDNFPSARPFLHLASYATVQSGATTNFDFTSHGTALIRGKYQAPPWTPGIEWAAEWAQPSDLHYFDYALVGAPPRAHGRFLLAPWMTPVTFSGTWRLYKLK